MGITSEITIHIFHHTGWFMGVSAVKSATFSTAVLMSPEMRESSPTCRLRLRYFLWDSGNDHYWTGLTFKLTVLKHNLTVSHNSNLTDYCCVVSSNPSVRSQRSGLHTLVGVPHSAGFSRGHSVASWGHKLPWLEGGYHLSGPYSHNLPNPF